MTFGSQHSDAADFKEASRTQDHTSQAIGPTGTPENVYPWTPTDRRLVHGNENSWYRRIHKTQSATLRSAY
jgi:hypothetical protein